MIFQRRPHPGQVSLERVFAEVLRAFPADLDVRTRVLPFESRRIVPRLRNMHFAWRNRGRVNHVAGDVNYIALALPRKSVVLTVADFASIYRLSGFRKVLYVWLWYRLPLHRAARVTTISHWTERELAKLFPRAAAKSEVIHCPVSSSLCPSPPPRNPCPVILQVGTGANKNLQRVAEALEGLPVRLRILGPLSAAAEARLRTISIEYSHVAGLTDQQVALEYSGADVITFVSTYEGFGLPILEAQAAGRPVVTSSAASMPEVAGDGALLVDPFNVSAIRSAVSSVLGDPHLYNELVRLGLANVSRFNARLIAARYAAVYSRVALRLR